jgi:hypothetical protein
VILTHINLRTFALAALIPLVSSCAPGEVDVPGEREPEASPSPYLFVWAR